VSGCVLGTTEGRARYVQKLKEVRANVFKEDEIIKRVRQIATRIQPYANNGYSHRSGSVEWLCQNIGERARSIDEQLNSSPKLSTFENGILRLTDWKPYTTSGGQFDLATSTDGKKLLHIVATGSSASWRSRVMLPTGQYRFEGYVRTRHAGQGALGAQLRMSGVTALPVLHGDAEWTMLNFNFEIAEPNRDVWLVCELKGSQGEAWFDISSLKIRKIE
jgi:hypothetical protein